MIKRVKIPIYGGTLSFVIAKTIDEGAAEIKTEIDENLANGSSAICLRRDCLFFAIIIEEEVIDRPDIIAHESKHLVNYVFEDRGIRLDVTNDEAECYFLGWVVKEFHKAIDQYKKAKCKT